MGDLESHYRREGEHVLIEMKLNSVAQLFNSLDPAPFHEKDLDDDAEEYIVGAAREFPLKTPLTLVIQLPREAVTPQTGSAVATAIHHYFAYRALATDRELRLRLRHGRASLVIGLLFLFACISARQLVANLGHGTFQEILQEGLLISGWVAMWRPIQIFLYDWWPVRNLRELYRKLALLRVEVRPTG